MELKTRLSYPDPFKPVGIEFELPEDATVTVKIFDEKGNEVNTVITDEPFEAGKHFLNVNLKSLQGGVLSYRVTAAGADATYSDTKRIL